MSVSLGGINKYYWAPIFFCKESAFIDKIIKSIIEQSGQGVTEEETREDI